MSKIKLKAKIAVVYISTPHPIVKVLLLRNSRLIRAFLHTELLFGGTSGKTQTIIQKQRKRSN